jgi:hypothetical protein
LEGYFQIDSIHCLKVKKKKIFKLKNLVKK